MPEPDLPLAVQADRLVVQLGTLNDAVVASNNAIAASNDAIVESNKRIAELGDASRHNQRLIRVLAASIVIDVLFSLGLGFALAKSHSASLNAERAATSAKAAAAANAATIKTTCLAANDSRARNVQLWEYILTLSPATTPEAKARGDQLLAYVHETFKQRDCG